MRPLDDAPNTDELLPDLLAGARDRTDRAEVTDALDAIDGALTDNIRPLTGAAAMSGDVEKINLRWEAAYWEHLARFGRRKRAWRSGWDKWALSFHRGGDEMGRNTVVIGPWVIALWSCHCADCKAEERALLAIIDAPEESA